MSRTGDCWDNAVTESFFATLKTELIHRQPWPTRRAATDAVADYIEGFYNPYRLHSSLGYLSPNAFERRGSGHFPQGRSDHTLLHQPRIAATPCPPGKVTHTNFRRAL